MTKLVWVCTAPASALENRERIRSFAEMKVWPTSATGTCNKRENLGKYLRKAVKARGERNEKFGTLTLTMRFALERTFKAT
jgi:hypothetical protein